MSAQYKKNARPPLMICIVKNGLKKSAPGKNDELQHCARLGNVCIRSSTSISLKETGSAVCLAKKSRSNSHRQNSAGAVLGVRHWARASAVAVVLSKKFFSYPHQPTIDTASHLNATNVTIQTSQPTFFALINKHKQTTFAPRQDCHINGFKILVFDNESWLLRAHIRRSVLSSRLYHDII